MWRAYQGMVCCTTRHENQKPVGFLAADQRNEVWNMLEDEVYDRAVDRAANAGDPDQLRPDEPNDDDDAINHHAAQANGNPMFLGLNEFDVVDVPPAGIHAVNPLHTLRTDVAREIMTLRRQPTMAADGNPLLYYRDNETHCPYIIPVARAILAIPASSAPSGRVFSTAGLVMRANRGRLDPSIVEDVVFLKGFYKFMDRNPGFLRA